MGLARKAGLSGKGEERRRPKPTLTYYRSRSRSEVADSPFERRAAKKRFKPRLFLSRGFDVVIVAVIALGLLYSLIVRAQASVSVSSTVYHPATLYAQAAQKQLAGFKNSNKITFDESAVGQNLKKQFPEVAQAVIELPLFGQKPKISLSIAPPAFWLQSGQDKYIVDNQGVVVALAKNQPAISKLQTVVDSSGFKAAAGKQVLSSQSVSFIRTVIAECQRSNVPIATLSLPTKVQELDLKTTDRPYFVKFFMGGDPVLQTGQFLAARHHFDQSGPQPATYLDVRVSGRIYSK